MSAGRLTACAVGLTLTLGALVWAAGGLPAFGSQEHRYGAITAHGAVPERSATNSVMVVAFDYRGVDTLGEEFILLVSAIGVMVLLRSLREEREEREEPPLSPPRVGLPESESASRLGAALLGPVLVLGADIVTHGQITPGGGFQGGVVLAGAMALFFLAGRRSLLVRLRGPSSWIEAAEAVGAAGFVIIGFGGMVAGAEFLYNFLPKGSTGLLTGGTIPVSNVSVGLEVAGAILVVLSELFESRLSSESD